MRSDAWERIMGEDQIKISKKLTQDISSTQKINRDIKKINLCKDL